MSASQVAVGAAVVRLGEGAGGRAARADSLPQPSPRMLEACRRGDPDAFAWLFRSYRDHVYRLAIHVCGNPSDAGDVTQDVFLKLLTRVKQFREDARFTTWLYRIALNTAFDVHRARRPSLSLDELPALPAAGPPAQLRAVERDDQRREVRQALAALLPQFRAAVILRYAEELSYEQIAEVLGVSKGTVASRLNRGLRELGRALERVRAGGRA